MRKRIFIAGVVLAAAVFVVGVFVLRGNDGDKKAERGGLSAEEIALLGSIGADAGANNANDTNIANGANTADEADDANGANDANKTGKQFRHPRLGFTLELPEGFSAGKFDEEENGAVGETALVRGPDGEQLQIYATAFEEEGQITPERIRKDLPNLVISTPQQVVLHGGMQALAFLSENESLGKTQEIWFAHNGFLYQLTTTAPLSKDVAGIIGSMKF